MLADDNERGLSMRYFHAIAIRHRGVEMAKRNNVGMNEARGKVGGSGSAGGSSSGGGNGVSKVGAAKRELRWHLPGSSSRPLSRSSSAKQPALRFDYNAKVF